MKAYIKQNQIKFIMNIPLIRNEIFTYYKLIPLPIFQNGQTTLILPKNPYLLVKGLKATPLSQSCREIDEYRFLCYENSVPPFIDDKCVIEIMQFHNNISSCHPIPITIENIMVYRIQPTRWIIYSNAETTINQFCDNEVTQDTIQGTYLLTIDDNCRAEIMGHILKRHQTQGKEITYLKQPVIHLPKIAPDSPITPIKPINVDGTNLADIQFLNLLLQKSKSEIISDSELSNSYINNVAFKSVSLVNIVVVIILSIIVLVIFRHKITYICKNMKKRDNPADNLELEEGGVMSAQPYPRSLFVTTST